MADSLEFAVGKRLARLVELGLFRRLRETRHILNVQQHTFSDSLLEQ